MNEARRIIIGISGASGAAYGFAALKMLRDMGGAEIHLVITRPAERTIAHELDGMSRADMEKLADCVYAPEDIGAAIASGSFRADGMLVAPCSVRTLSAVAYSMADNLLTRAADICLKERRRLVLMVRETPLHAGHLKAMQAVTEMGGIIAPPVPALYAKPQDVADIVAQSTGRAIELLGLAPPVVRWNGTD